MLISLNKLTKQQGYLMIEILVALIIFSGALIGLIALQLNSYSSTQSAGYRSMANNYADDFFDKMRANKSAANNQLYSSLSAANNSCRVVNFNTSNTVASCSASQLAQDDLQEFKNQISSTLPQGVGVVCIDSSLAQGTPTSPNCDGIGNSYAVKIFWKDTRSKAIAKNSGYSQVIVGVKI